MGNGRFETFDIAMVLGGSDVPQSHNGRLELCV